MIGMFIRSYTKGRFLLGRLNGVEFISWTEDWGEEELRRSIHSFRTSAKHLVQQHFPGLPFDIMTAAVRYPDDAVTPSELHQKGVAAMAEAQQRYQEEIVFFRPSMIEGLNKEILLHNALEAAISTGEFLVYYQEQVNIRTGAVSGLEVLSRWKNGEEGFVSPDVFIPVLTKYNLIIQFSQLVFVKVLEDLPLVVSRYGGEATVSVNISPVFFLSEGFATFIARKLAEHKVPPSSVILEITEDVFIDDLSTIRDIIEEVKALGVSVSLDDFGKGFSSLSYLSSLPLDEVKIDKEFIKTILYDSRQFGVVKSICDLAKILGYQVVIEGIETEEQVAKIKETSCDLVQGYYYSRPAPLRG
jgi:EAL domain-containing protein (putative c-di-GMP-specific phosphodiesterase class I)